MGFSSKMLVSFLLLLKMVGVIGQSDFISIDCGSPAKSNYTDPNTRIVYVSDEAFINTGTNYNLSSYITASLEKQLLNVRSFPNGTRNCYKIHPVKRNAKYLVRATFMHGNYDDLQQVGPSKPLLFNLHIDVTLWKTVNISEVSKIYRVEVIAVALANSISVCLINTGSGTPFISALELRPLKSNNYHYANTNQYLVPIYRFNIGAASDELIIRYPSDPYDRIWSPWNSNAWNTISTDSPVILDKDEAEAPSAVMRTAAVPVNSSAISFSMSWEGTEVPRNEFYFHLYMAELVPKVSRPLNVYINGDSWWFNYTPTYLMTDVLYSTTPITPQSPEYIFVINSTGRSRFAPLLNALEFHWPIYLTEVATDANDVDAINAIKENYKVEKNWMGDPCAPRAYAWDRLSCSYSTNSSRIVSVDLSSSALSGNISSSFSLLTELKYLDLSYNNLKGEIPDSLGSLSSLQVLNLTGNNFTKIPASLLEKSKRRLLLLRIDDNTQLCANATSCLPQDKKIKISTPIIVIISMVPVILIFVVIIIWWRLKKFQGLSFKKKSYKGLCIDEQIQFKNQQFTYKQLAHISGNFVRVLGKGGFGFVYHGYLESGKEVAIKMRSQSSTQGTKEFLAEAQNLTKVHHRNLVSLVGYCMDEKYLALVYEYMANGTLHDHLRGKIDHLRPLDWGERLRIGVQAAQGLEYLHKGCKPPIIHRDIKSSNILLGEDMEAKIADFGLSRALQSDDQTHISTVAVVGTPGYVDPEYHSTLQLNEKTDVYSFGVVLLELITGKPPIIQGAVNVHIAQYVAPKLATGELDGIVDERLQGEYDYNSVWKVLDLALRCTAQTTSQRPTMSEVVTQLKDSLELETDCGKSENMSGEMFRIIQTSVLELGDNIPGHGPSAR